MQINELSHLQFQKRKNSKAEKVKFKNRREFMEVWNMKMRQLEELTVEPKRAG